MTGTDPGPNPIDELRSRRERRSEEERQRLEEERLRKLDAAQFALSRTDKSAELLRKEQEELRKIQREEEQITREEDAIKRQEKLEEKLLNARLESDQEIAELRRSTDMAIANLRNEGKGDRLREDMFRQNSTVLPDLLGAAQDQAALVREGKETRSAEELKEEYLLAVEGQLVGIDEDVKPFLKRAALHWERTVGKAIRAAEEERAKQEAERKRTSIPLTEREQARGGADPLLGVLRSVLETQGQSALNVPQRPPFIGKQ